MLTGEATQVLFKAAIDNFCLTVCLGMIYRTHFQFRALNLEEFIPEGTDEDWIAVTYY